MWCTVYFLLRCMEYIVWSTKYLYGVRCNNVNVVGGVEMRNDKRNSRVVGEVRGACITE